MILVKLEDLQTLGPGLYEIDSPRAEREVFDPRIGTTRHAMCREVARIDRGVTVLPNGQIEAYLRPDGCRVVRGYLPIPDDHPGGV